MFTYQNDRCNHNITISNNPPCAVWTPTDHHFIGTDIDASNFPPKPPLRQTYHVQDINKPWAAEWKESFDLVHQRLVLAGGGPAQQHALKNLAALVKPGGWIQLIEATNELAEDAGPAMRNFVAILKGVFGVMGGKPHLGNELVGWLQAAGFEDVEGRIVSTKLGARKPNPVLAKRGVYSTLIGARGLAGFAISIIYGVIALRLNTAGIH